MVVQSLFLKRRSVFFTSKATIFSACRRGEIFDRSTVLGRTLREAFDAGVALVQEEVHTETGRRIQASVDFIYDDRTRMGLGALVTLHDLESVEEIESELELSRRMAAIGRLTAGVGHEVKNPINAIVVHLELLKNKLGGDHAPATRHLEVIDAEIHRLDRVVQTLVDFSRPVELQLREQDLRTVIGDVLALADDELTTRDVKLESQLPDHPLIVNVDADLLKQAALQRDPEWRTGDARRRSLRVQLEEDRKMAVVRIADEGDGNSAGNPRENLRSLLHDKERGQRHRAGDDLPHFAVAPRQRRRTIEGRPWHGILTAHSTRSHGMGTPASATGNCGRNKGVGDMKLSAMSAAGLLVLLLTGCFHKTQVAQNLPFAPPIEETPPPKPEPAPTNLPPPEVTLPEQTEPLQITPPPEPVKKPARHKKPANTNTQIASNGTAAVSAIGTLSTGDPPNTAADDR